MHTRILAKTNGHFPVRPDFGIRPVLLVFTYPTRGHSYGEQIAIIEQLPECLVQVEIVNVWNQLEYAARYGVLYIPTTIVLDAQQRVVTVNPDIVSADELRAQLAQACVNSVHRNSILTGVQG
jgi:hypothetical protein